MKILKKMFYVHSLIFFISSIKIINFTKPFLLIESKLRSIFNLRFIPAMVNYCKIFNIVCPTNYDYVDYEVNCKNANCTIDDEAFLEMPSK